MIDCTRRNVDHRYHVRSAPHHCTVAKAYGGSHNRAGPITTLRAGPFVDTVNGTYLIHVRRASMTGANASR